MPLYAANSTEHNTYFLALADIHFNPFHSCYSKTITPCPLITLLNSVPVKEWQSILAADENAPSTYKQDTNFSLLTSMLNKAKKISEEKQIAFVLILGDLLSHDFRQYYRQYARDNTNEGYRAFVKKTLVFLNIELAKTFPSLEIYQTIGNNDSYQDDYVSDPHGLFFKEMSTLWSSLIKDKPNRLLIKQQLRESGYYAFNLPNQPNIRFIILNTVLFSNKASGRDINLAAKKELRWLNRELTSVKLNHQKVFIAMHIPPTIDVNLGGRIHLFTFMELWQPLYKQMFQQTMQTFSSVILAIFAGHLHSDWLSIWTFGENEIPVIGTPSISPIFGNHPGFKIYRYANQSLQLMEYHTYYSPIAHGKLYDQQKTILNYSHQFIPSLFSSLDLIF
jgi:hypothetical protein